MRTFFDTNILIYLFDEDSPKKKVLAQQLFENETRAGRVVLSTQVIQEFYVAATKKLADPLCPEDAETVVRNLTALPLIQIDATMILTAIGKSRVLGFSFWDSLIVTAAIASGAECLFTEDLQHGQIIDGLRIENPFR